MSYSGEDIEKLAKRVRYDLTSAQTRVTELLQAVASLNLPAESQPYACPECGLTFKRDDLRDDHLMNVHGKDRT